MSFVTTNEFSVRVSKISSRIDVFYLSDLFLFYLVGFTFDKTLSFENSENIGNNFIKNYII